MEFPYDFTSDYHNTIFHFAPIFLCLYAIRHLLMPVTEIPLLPLFRLPFFFRRLLLSYLFLFPFSSPSSIDFFFYFFSIPHTTATFTRQKFYHLPIPFPSSQESWWWQFIFMLFPDFIFLHYVLCFLFFFCTSCCSFHVCTCVHIYKREFSQEEAHFFRTLLLGEKNII